MNLLGKEVVSSFKEPFIIYDREEIGHSINYYRDNSKDKNILPD